MRFVTKIGDRELETIAWLMQTKTKMHNIEFCKGCVLTIVVLVVAAYNIFFYSESTTAQKWILIILSVACIARTVACKLGKINYIELAKKKNKRIRDKEIICTFEETQVIVKVGKQSETLKYEELKEMGKYKHCLYLLFKNRAAIVIDERKQSQENIEKLREIILTSCGTATIN